MLEVGNKKETGNRFQFVNKSRKGKINEVVISCKRKEFNHHVGQSYSKFKEIPLASKGWHHKKSVGDHFVINAFGKNPAFSSVSGVDEHSFDSLGLRKEILTQITKVGFLKPTNIQLLAIPHVLDGKNALITAETGNGKTLTFVAPMLQQIAKYKTSFNLLPFNSPLGLIIVPGRELAEQICSVAQSLGKEMEINVKLVTGGKTKKLTLNPKVGQVHLLVGTLGVLSKLTTSGVYDMSFVKHIVLDEADSLLDDSFNEDLLHYLQRFPIQGVASEGTTQPLGMSGVQLTLVSATMPRSLQKILNPLIDVKTIQHISTPYLHCVMNHVPQQFFRMSYSTKAQKLLELASRSKDKGIPMIIFCNHSRSSDWVSFYLNENGISCINLHGGMNAGLRKGRFMKFQRGEEIALSCTDLTSRGLDTVRAGHIINFEFPTFISDYIHRCGRIGRVGSSIDGLITSLVVHRKEIETLQKIEYAARKSESFHNVNANITRILQNHTVVRDEESY
ncbi:hypothetical protein SK128_003346 [Halocaridina rubra]|uniref:RNA helicase n=1 Tax=Halocaridina rubra TaxID=373956 RepID=A0AAN8XA50_HALRR